MVPFPQPEGRRAMLRVWSTVLALVIVLNVTVPCAPRAYARSVALLDVALLILGLSCVLMARSMDADGKEDAR